MKDKSIESDIPRTFKLCHNRVSILVTSVVRFPVLGNLPSPENSACCQNAVTDAACLIQGLDIQNGPKWTTSIFQKAAQQSERLCAV